MVGEAAFNPDRTLARAFWTRSGLVGHARARVRQNLSTRLHRYGLRVVLHSVPDLNSLYPDVHKEVTVAYTDSWHVLEIVTGSPRISPNGLAIP